MLYYKKKQSLKAQCTGIYWVSWMKKLWLVTWGVVVFVIIGGLVYVGLANWVVNQIALAEAEQNLIADGYTITDKPFNITGTVYTAVDYQDFKDRVPTEMELYKKTYVAQGHWAIFNDTYHVLYAPGLEHLSWWPWGIL
jgi:hypothetical protein